ncbi:hypothetical protein [Mycobacterium stomatepiae]|nr:hypothetical protein [Mycobacterium stomatepiae]
MVGKESGHHDIHPPAGSAALVLIDMQRDFLDLPGGDTPMPLS